MKLCCHVSSFNPGKSTRILTVPERKDFDGPVGHCETVKGTVVKHFLVIGWDSKAIRYKLLMTTCCTFLTAPTARVQDPTVNKTSIHGSPETIHWPLLSQTKHLRRSLRNAAKNTLIFKSMFLSRWVHSESNFFSSRVFLLENPILSHWLSRSVLNKQFRFMVCVAQKKTSNPNSERK